MRYLPFFIILVFLNSCSVSFTGGTNIDYTKVKTFTITDFGNTADNVEPTLSQSMTDELRRKLRSETRLSENPANGDLEFIGTIKGYQISPVAPQAGETTAFNRLTITLEVSYVNLTNDTDKWQQAFTAFEDFPSDQNFSDVQEELIGVITEDITQQVFNKAFSGW